MPLYTIFVAVSCNYYLRPGHMKSKYTRDETDVAHSWLWFLWP